MGAIIQKEINPRFEQFIFDWDYSFYFLVGSYGSSKSYHTALKIILKLMHEKRKALIIREVFDTLKESCFDLLCEILDSMDFLSANVRRTKGEIRAIATSNPMLILFPNGSKIIFKGMDKPQKIKSINGVSIVWLEEASEIKYSGFKEITLRLRIPEGRIYYFLTTNPVGAENWTYKYFFKNIDDSGKEHVILDDIRLYRLKTIVKNGVYYHHSVPEDNLFLQQSYIRQLDAMKEYDEDLYRIARLGQYGINGMRVLPQFIVANTHEEVMSKVKEIPRNYRFVGMDFGFEVSYNAIIKMAVDDKAKILYLYWEYYKNHMTDDMTIKDLEKEDGLKEDLIIADSAEPKAIKYFQQCGFKMRPCRKATNNGVGSRLQNVKKIKRFKKIICSPELKNSIRELRTLSYVKDNKGEFIYDEFNIDSHIFSAMWYGLDLYNVSDIKESIKNHKAGGEIDGKSVRIS